MLINRNIILPKIYRGNPWIDISFGLFKYDFFTLYFVPRESFIFTILGLGFGLEWNGKRKREFMEELTKKLRKKWEEYLTHILN